MTRPLFKRAVSLLDLVSYARALYEQNSNIGRFYKHPTLVQRTALIHDSKVSFP